MSLFSMYDASRCSYFIVLMYFHKESATVMVRLLMAMEDIQYTVSIGDGRTS